MKFGFAAIALVGIASWVLISATTAEELRVEDGCLRYDSSLPRVNNRMLRNPLFRIEYRSRPDDGYPEAKFEVLVSFWKKGVKLRAALIEKGMPPAFERCRVFSTDTGLISYEDNNSDNCPIMDRTISAPIDRNENYGTVRIECVDAHGIDNCIVSEVYPGGWRADIFVPIEEVRRWRDVSDVTEQFYLTNFQNCGE